MGNTIVSILKLKKINAFGKTSSVCVSRNDEDSNSALIQVYFDCHIREDDNDRSTALHYSKYWCSEQYLLEDTAAMVS